jgi:PGF-pre-PGF domain-containing protein
VTDTSGGTVSVIKTSDNSVTTVTVGSGPSGVAVSPDGSKVYVANNLGKTVSVINTVTNVVTATVNVGTKPFAYGQFIIPPDSVIYNSNGATGGTVPTDSSSAYAPGATVTVLGNTGTLVKTGATFSNWNTAADGTGTSYAPAATFTITANTILYAQWTTAPTQTPTPAPQSPGGDSDSGQAPVAEVAPGNISVNVGGNTHITRVTVTGTGLKNLIVTSAEATGPGTGIQPPPGIINKYLDLTPARYTTITSAQISFVVPQSWLVENHLTPQQIVLYHNVGTGWQALPTTFVKNKNGENYYTAESPGFSRYAITGQVNLTTGSQNTTPSPTVMTIGDLAKSSTLPPPTIVAPSLKQTPVPTPMPPVASTTPMAALDMRLVLGALVLCGAIFLFRKNGN